MLINIYILKSDEKLPLQKMTKLPPPSPPPPPPARSPLGIENNSIFNHIIEETVNAKRFLISTAIACFEALFLFQL